MKLPVTEYVPCYRIIKSCIPSPSGRGPGRGDTMQEYLAGAKLLNYPLQERI